MHEMAICESVIQIIEDRVAVDKFRKVKRVSLEVGQFSGVELEALRFGFDVVTRGTCAENADLEVIETKAHAWCMPCAKSVAVKERFDACPDCGSYQLQISGGEDLRIKELEVD